MTTLQWVGAGFVLVLIAFLFYAYVRPQTQEREGPDIIRFICSMCAGFAGGLFVGEALFSGNWSSGATGKIALTGSAGFAFAFIVWYGYGRLRHLPEGYSYAVPQGWTFRHTAKAMIDQQNAVVDFLGFSEAELNARLRPAKVTKSSLTEALGSLGSLSESTIRPYDVEYADPRYVLKVRPEGGAT